MDMSNEDSLKPDSLPAEEAFKKPILIGKIGKLPKKVIPPTDNVNDNKTKEYSEENIVPESNAVDPITEKSQLQQVTLSYKEPSWSGLPDSTGIPYKFEVLKNGCIIETIDLMERPFWTFGRLADCNICMQHPTVSRYHAVLQYRSEASDTETPGYYIYDLGGTHGTFLNKKRLLPKIYTRIQVGHMLKFGCSTRSYILVGPENDTEAESELSVTELKEKRAEQVRKFEEDAIRAKKEQEERQRREEERGIDWGMGEDADEETDLTENPYAQTNNEQLYLDDPKKALRGFFEREGFNLEYDCSEQGLGQFLCRVELPIDDEMGRPIIAEVLHKGKKKEAVIQCALEACRILDRHGVLRQAIHESRKRKAKNWEENDYYDSDDDTFLDRTGTIEKKREMRMKSKQPQQPETYESLLEKEKMLCECIRKIERELEQGENVHRNPSSNEVDSLDSFMMELNQPSMDKQTSIRLKMELVKLRKEHENVVRLVNIAKPADLPSFEAHSSTSATVNKSSKFPMFGKRLKVKVQVPNRAIETVEDEETTDSREESKPKPQTKLSEVNSIKELWQSFVRKVDEILKRDFAQKYREPLEEILSTLRKFATSEDRILIESKYINAKQRKVDKLIGDLLEFGQDPKLEDRISVELKRIINDLREINVKKINMMNEVREESVKIEKICQTINTDLKEEYRKITCEPSTSGEELRKKKNQRRIHQRQEKAAIEKERGYEEDAVKENYTMWVPPSGQSGDGRTNLNEKYGY